MKGTKHSWKSMKSRCDDPAREEYKNYGGRGITYDPRWWWFENFLTDMGLRPQGLTLDRVDNNGNYSKDNCRWATWSEQMLNTRIRVTNTSGVTGVHWSNQNKKWNARITIRGVTHQLGFYPNFEDAVAARKAAERNI